MRPVEGASKRSISEDGGRLDMETSAMRMAVAGGSPLRIGTDGGNLSGGAAVGAAAIANRLEAAHARALKKPAGRPI
jgi:hypothetical protein